MELQSEDDFYFGLLNFPLCNPRHTQQSEYHPAMAIGLNFSVPQWLKDLNMGLLQTSQKLLQSHYPNGESWEITNRKKWANEGMIEAEHKCSKKSRSEQSTTVKAGDAYIFLKENGKPHNQCKTQKPNIVLQLNKGKEGAVLSGT